MGQNLEEKNVFGKEKKSLLHKNYHYFFPRGLRIKEMSDLYVLFFSRTTLPHHHSQMQKNFNGNQSHQYFCLDLYGFQHTQHDSIYPPPRYVGNLIKCNLRVLSLVSFNLPLLPKKPLLKDLDKMTH